MIKTIGDKYVILGISHASPKSIEIIDAAFKEFDPAVVCLEIDRQRFKELYSAKKTKMSFVSKFKKYGMLGYLLSYYGTRSQILLTEGLEPSFGQEMVYSFDRAVEAGKIVSLIDTPLSETIDRIHRLGVVKKMMMIFQICYLSLRKDFRDLFVDYKSSRKMDPEFVEIVVNMTKKHLNPIYNIAIRQRDEEMSERIMTLSSLHKEGRVLVIVGAAHVQGIASKIEKYITHQS